MSAAIVQTKVESHTENIDLLLLNKLVELRKSLSPALVEEIMKPGALKDSKQHIVSMGTKSQMTSKYLKDVSTRLAIVSVVREGGLKRQFSPEREI